MLTPKEKKKLQKQWMQLRSEINRHDQLYYKESRPEISDFEYDCLKSELLHLESLLPKIPKIGVGDDRGGTLLTRKHHVPMLSLENTYNLDDVYHFDARIRKLLNTKDPIDYVVEPKIDGLAINLIYEHGQFVCAVTRGNGIEGDDVTDNVKTIQGLPLQICDVPELIEIRGEVYIDQEIFQKINCERALSGQELFANARNLASGTLKLMDSEEAKSRHLKLLTYGIGAGHHFEKQHEIYPFLKKQGFVSQSVYHLISGLDRVADVVQQLDDERKTLPYGTDGVVFKVDLCALQEKLGATIKTPRWAFAYKFEPEKAETVLKKITLQVGRMGTITPVAELEPVELSGSVVARATLHNAEEIAKKDIREKDVVVIEKSGEIIPAVIAVKKECRGASSVPFVFPSVCPCCGTQLVRVDGEVAWRCPNKSCREQIVQRIIYFSSKAVIDIDGLGESIVRELVSNGLVSDGPDLYKLTNSDLFALKLRSEEKEHKLGEKSVQKLLSNIAQSKNTTLDRWINALGIPLVGAKTSKDIAKHFPSIDAFLSASEEQLSQINGVGSKCAKSIVSFRENSANFITAMRDIGFNFQKNEIISPHPELSGKTFILTGKLQHFKRSEAQQNIEQRGGIVINVFSKAVNIVIAGEDAGQKLALAQQCGIPIWTEEQFIKKLQDS